MHSADWWARRKNLNGVYLEIRVPSIGQQRRQRRRAEGCREPSRAGDRGLAGRFVRQGPRDRCLRQSGADFTIASLNTTATLDIDIAPLANGDFVVVHE